ncbi:MAG: type IV pilus assembly protein PilM [Syntrophobacteraceae bacterium]
MFRKKENIVGLDVGSHCIKMVQVNTAATPVRILNFGLISVPAEAFVEGRVNKSEAIAGSIQQLASNLKLKDRSVVTSVSGYEVMIKKIELPSMTEEDLRNRMQAELGQYIPYNIEEVDVDYQILDIVADRPNFMNVMLVAAKKESIGDYVNLVRLAGLDPVVVDVDYFALSNAYEASYGLKGDENIVLLDIGANKAVMNIISRGIPIFTRGLSIGGSQITDRIREHFKISQDEAERAKLGGGLVQLPIDELEAIFVACVKKWVSEIRRAIDFFYSNFPESKIERIMLSGGSAGIAGLGQVFEEHLETRVEIFNPFLHLDYDTKVVDPDYLSLVGPQMAIAFGLALRRTR